MSTIPCFKPLLTLLFTTSLIGTSVAQTTNIVQKFTEPNKIQVLKEWNIPAAYEMKAAGNVELKATVEKKEKGAQRVMIVSPANAPEVMLEFFIVLKSSAGEAIHLVDNQEATGGAPVEFSTGRNEIKMYRGDFANSPLMTYNSSKCIGWFVRAISNNKIIGVAASSKLLKILAADPAAVEQMYLDQIEKKKK